MRSESGEVHRGTERLEDLGWQFPIKILIPFTISQSCFLTQRIKTTCRDDNVKLNKTLTSNNPKVNDHFLSPRWAKNSGKSFYFLLFFTFTLSRIYRLEYTECLVKKIKELIFFIPVGPFKTTRAVNRKLKVALVQYTSLPTMFLKNLDFCCERQQNIVSLTRVYMYVLKY